ncbi:hypothetical protein GW796_06470 [archaeon]|nr:hypothetical protein [archaeon]
MEYIKPKHYWEYCDHCETNVVICGTCGNNCCNGGHGEVIGAEPNTTIPCPDCPSAYDLQTQEWNNGNNPVST